jgi:hypothetical protein
VPEAGTVPVVFRTKEEMAQYLGNKRLFFGSSSEILLGTEFQANLTFVVIVQARSESVLFQH